MGKDKQPFEIAQLQMNAWFSFFLHQQEKLVLSNLSLLYYLHSAANKHGVLQSKDRVQ